MKSRLAPHLQIVTSLLWPWFLAWTALAFVIMPLQIGEDHVSQWIGDPAKNGLAAALSHLLRMFDTIWIVLAATNLYFFLVSAERLATARRWSLRILGACALVTFLNAATGFPFGRLVYTGKLGWRFFDLLPFAVPLLWFVVIAGCRYAVLALVPKAAGWARWRLSLATAALVLLTDLNLERVAWHARFYWIWYPRQPESPAWPPVQNFAAWFAAAFLISLLLPPPGSRPGAPAEKRDLSKPLIIVLLMNALFLTIHLFR